MARTLGACPGRAVALAHEMGMPPQKGARRRVLGQVLQARRRTAEACDAFEKSLALLDSAPYEAARTKLQWGLALKSAGDGDRGTRLMQEARATFIQLGAQHELKEADELLSV